MTTRPAEIAIIMPVLNAAETLQGTLDSIFAQTFTDFELIVIDNGSTDGSMEILSGCADARIRLISEPRKGVSRARNAGLHAVTSPLVAFIDADDTWVPTALETLHAAIHAHEDVALVYCGWRNIGAADRRQQQDYIPPDYESVNKIEALFEDCPWPIHAALTRLDALKEAGFFDTRYAVGEDYLLWFRIAGKHPIRRVPESLARYHHHGDTQACSDRARAAAQLYSAQQLLLEEFPEIRAQVPRARLRVLTVGALLRKGYRCYWDRDLKASRRIFRLVMRHGYGGIRDWMYMLPSLLPAPAHAALIAAFGRNNRQKPIDN